VNRRSFLKASSVALAGTALTPAIKGQKPSLASGRSVLPINRGWRYSPHLIQGGEAVDFDDSGLARVVVPHTNVRLPWHGFDEKVYEFVSLYRRRLKVPADTAGKRVFVDFEGVMTDSTVYLNGERLGEDKGGYTPFSFELTHHCVAHCAADVSPEHLCSPAQRTERSAFRGRGMHSGLGSWTRGWPPYAARRVAPCRQ